MRLENSLRDDILVIALPLAKIVSAAVTICDIDFSKFKVMIPELERLRVFLPFHAFNEVTISWLREPTSFSLFCRIVEGSMETQLRH